MVDRMPLALQPISLLHGWVPITIQLIAAAVLLVAIGWRSRRWRLLWMPVSLLLGVAVAFAIQWYLNWSGVAGHPAPPTLWIWITLSAMAGAVLVFGWRDNRWWRRTVSLFAVPLCVLCSALAVDLWTGYVPTVQTGWAQLTGQPLPGQTDEASVAAMREHGDKPAQGTIVSVTIPNDASHFAHRGEFVYLPPAWYASNPPPRLPVVMMVSTQFGTAQDWLRIGNAKKTVDDFAASHGGNAPVLVLVDSTSAFSNDTECVNGVRGNAADHLTKDVVPYVSSHFGTSADPANWGIVGLSVGGTCAVTLTVKYPELFSGFVDIDGDLFPNVGFKEQTIPRLFGGDTEAFASFDPSEVMAKHGPYTGVAGWFAVSGDVPTVYHDGTVGADDPGPIDYSADRGEAANYLCALASRYGIECSVVGMPGNHDWPFGATVFADALPWLAGKLHTPGVPQTPLPGAPTAQQGVAGGN
jgi:S-formylglutathione hydrolase FrmB